MKKRRINGKNGWIKEPCHYSKTGWAWAKEDGICTCEPCKPPGTDESKSHNDLKNVRIVSKEGR